MYFCKYSFCQQGLTRSNTFCELLRRDGVRLGWVRLPADGGSAAHRHLLGESLALAAVENHQLETRRVAMDRFILEGTRLAPQLQAVRSALRPEVEKVFWPPDYLSYLWVHKT